MDTEHIEYVVNVIAHVDHGKTSVIDNVLEYLGVLSKQMAGEARLLDSRKDEIEREMTMKLSPVSVPLGSRTITFLDTPGHLEFNSLTLSTFVISDISLIIVDCIKGVTARLKGLLKRVVENKTIPILFINKIDMFFKLNISPDEIEYRVESILLETNIVLEETITWDNSSVIIGSAKDNWALSVNSKAGRLTNNKIESLSLKQALKLARAVYRQKESELESLGERIGKQITKRKPGPNDILSYEFNFFETLKESITQQKPSSNVCSMENSSVPEAVIGIVCSNTVIENRLVSITRTIRKRKLNTKEKVYLIENNRVSEVPERNIIRFTPDQPLVQEGTGLLGVIGIDCKKRGILVSEVSEETEQFFNSLKWIQFMPLFTDMIISDPDCFEEVLRRVAMHSRCEPGMVCLLTKNKEIIIQSDGELQLDKLQTDLEGLSYIVKEKSEKYQETTEYATGIIQDKQTQSEYKVTFRRVQAPDIDDLMYRLDNPTEDRTNSTKTQDNPTKENSYLTEEQLFDSDCYFKYSEDVPASIKHIARSLLQKGPFILEQCNQIELTIERINTSEKTKDNKDNKDSKDRLACDSDSQIPKIESETSIQKNTHLSSTGSTLQQIYLSGTPRILINLTLLTVTVPLASAKQASLAISRVHAAIIKTVIGQTEMVYTIKIPIKEIRQFTNTIRTLARGEADILPSHLLFFDLPTTKEQEIQISSAIREQKGILQKDKIVE
ncbi:elongation factor 2 [Nematocida sp. AWRm80]|nr:elongation factor 2 [Nematocida sp. AWRm80]